MREKSAMGGYDSKVYRVVREDISEEVTGDQSPGDCCEGAGFLKMEEAFFKRGNNRHKGPKVFTEQLLVSRYLARCHIYHGGQNGCELLLSWHLAIT